MLAQPVAKLSLEVHLYAAAASTYINTLQNADQKKFASAHWVWLAKGQLGMQPGCPNGVKEADACLIRTSLNQAYAAPDPAPPVDAVV